MHLEKAARYRDKHGPVIRERRRAERAARSYESRRDFDLKNKYGLSLERFNGMLAAQGGGCAICGETEGRMNVDHCHRSGEIRGVLCIKCNVALGAFRDSQSLMKSAITYLENN